jgi:hypothetical protein
MGVFDFTAVFETLATGDYTLTRRTPGAVDANGRATAATSVDVELTGIIVQPEKSLADDEQRHPVGGWSTDRLKVIVPIAQLVASGGALTATTTDRLADRLTYGGKTYEVTDSLDHTETGAYSFARFGIIDTTVEA